MASKNRTIPVSMDFTGISFADQLSGLCIGEPLNISDEHAHVLIERLRAAKRKDERLAVLGEMTWQEREACRRIEGRYGKTREQIAEARAKRDAAKMRETLAEMRDEAVRAIDKEADLAR